MLPVNMLSTRLGLALISIAALVSCEPEVQSHEALQVLIDQNNKLRDSITNMELTVSRSGEIDPTLEARIQETEHALTQKLRELTALQTKNNQDHIRLLDLEQRMGIFETEFRAIQQEASSVNTSR